MTISGIQTGDGIDSGYFGIILQGNQNTDTVNYALFTLQTSGSDIAYTMQTAVLNNVPYYEIECYSFYVTKSLSTIKLSDGTFSTTLILSITFVHDNLYPYTLLEVDPNGLTGMH